jgi:hypothetical protein
MVGAGEDITGLDFGSHSTGIDPLPGDFNRDGDVGAADFVVWRKTLGTSVPNFSGADGDGSGVVDQADYGLWRANFGASQPDSAAASVVAALADQPQAGRTTATPKPVGHVAAGFLPEGQVVTVLAHSGRDFGSRLSSAETATDASPEREAALLAFLSSSPNGAPVQRELEIIARDARADSSSASIFWLDEAFLGLSANLHSAL